MPASVTGARATARADRWVDTAAAARRGAATWHAATNWKPLLRIVRIDCCASGVSSIARRARLTACVSEASVTAIPFHTVASSSSLVTRRSRWRAR